MDILINLVFIGDHNYAITRNIKLHTDLFKINFPKYVK